MNIPKEPETSWVEDAAEYAEMLAGECPKIPRSLVKSGPEYLEVSNKAAKQSHQDLLWSIFSIIAERAATGHFSAYIEVKCFVMRDFLLRQLGDCGFHRYRLPADEGKNKYPFMVYWGELAKENQEPPSDSPDEDMY